MRGSRTGVFCGALGGETLDYAMARHDPDLEGYVTTSSYNYMIPAQIAFSYDLKGPSSHVSTACSSSFAALDAAVNSLILGHCEAAIVTGSCLFLNPRSFSDLLAMNALSMDGRCKTFDVSGTILMMHALSSYNASPCTEKFLLQQMVTVKGNQRWQY